MMRHLRLFQHDEFVQDLVHTAGHGKLLVDTTLYPSSYATNVNEQYFSKIDLLRRNRTAAFDFSTSMPTYGAHSIVYSNISRQ